MVLKSSQVEVSPKGFLEKREFNSFIVLDSSSISYGEEEEIFGYSIEILNLVRVVSKANKMCSDFKSDFRINTDIYYKAIDSILNNIPFSDAELESYIESEQKKEDFLTFSRSLADIENEFYLPYQVDFILLGMCIEAYTKLNEEEKEALHESYNDMAHEVRFKKIGVRDYILKAKGLLISSRVIKIAAECNNAI
ncbi:hypothetical protein D3C85_1089440 [compost metagenome]